MDGARRNEERNPRAGREPFHHLDNPAVERRLTYPLSAGWLSQTDRNRRARLRLENVPHLRLATLLAMSLRIGVVRMDLNRETIRREQKLHQHGQNGAIRKPDLPDSPPFFVLKPGARGCGAPILFEDVGRQFPQRHELTQFLDGLVDSVESALQFL